eukprot:gene3767-4289_t
MTSLDGSMVEVQRPVDHVITNNTFVLYCCVTRALKEATQREEERTDLLCSGHFATQVKERHVYCWFYYLLKLVENMAAASTEPSTETATEAHDESHLKLFGVCVDDTEHSQRAFEWYMNCCHKKGNKLALIHIHVPPPLPAVPMYPAGAAIISEEWQRSLQQSVDASRHLIQALKKKCLKHKVPYIIFAETDQGSPGAAITRIANDNNLVMLTLGTRAFGGLKRAFLGSVSDYVVHHAQCPVTVIPPPMEKKEDK